MKYCHCGKILPRGHGYKPSTKYCSVECLKSKPPTVLNLERVFGQGIKEILTEVEIMRNSVQCKSDLLGITRQTYYKYKKLYL